MTHIVNFSLQQPVSPLSSWWVRESSVLGQIVASVLGLAAIAGAFLPIVAFFRIPAELMDHMEMGGYLLGFGLVTLLFLLPMLICGVWLLVSAKHQMVTPRSLLLMLIVVVPLSIGAGVWGHYLINKGVAAQEQTDALMRDRAIRDFVGRMKLRGAEHDAMLEKVTAMPDSSLCIAAVLPLERCRRVQGN